jgi:hypothetical protein
MKRHWVVRALKFLAFAIVAGGVLTLVVMSLWNWLMPALFGSPLITFWQALGLLVLARVLFGRFGGGPGPRMHWRHRMMERWNQMTPEEREKFMEGMKGRCGRFEPRVAGPAA